MGQANLTFNAEFLGDGRVTQIGVDKQNAFADFSDGRSNVCGNRGFTFARPGGGDDQQVTMLFGVGGKECDIRADTAEFLSFLAAGLCNNHWTGLSKQVGTLHGAERGSMSQFTHVGGAFNLGVQHVKQQGDTDTADDAEYNPGSKIQRGFRRAWGLRGGSLLNEGELDWGFGRLVRVQG